MTHRELFERWYRATGAACIEQEEIAAHLGYDDELDEYDEPDVNLMWRCWVAASRDPLDCLRAAYRQISGDYTDGGQYRDDRMVIEMMLPLISESTSAQTESPA